MHSFWKMSVRWFRFNRSADRFPICISLGDGLALGGDKASLNPLMPDIIEAVCGR